MGRSVQKWLGRFMAASGIGREAGWREWKRWRGVEALEGRVMLSVSTGDFAGPFNVVGTTWTYVPFAPNGTASLQETATGAGTFMGQSVQVVQVTSTFVVPETDTVPAHTVVSHGTTYLSVVGGTLAIVGETTTTASGSVSTTSYSPSEGQYPTDMTAGVTYSTTDTVTTVTDGGTPSTFTEVRELKLATETLLPVTLFAGTPQQVIYETYQINETDTVQASDTTSGGVFTSVLYIAPGVGMVETFVGGNLVTPSVQLGSFVTGGRLTFVERPEDVAVGAKQEIKVGVIGQDGLIDTTSKKAITLTLSSGLGSTGKLGGTLTVNAVNGVATFKDITVDKSGQYTLTASDGGSESIPSGLFNITAGTLKFVKAPKTGNVDEAFDPVLQVELVDAQGNVLTSGDGSVVTLNVVGLRAITRHVSGNTAVLVNGMATFSGFTIGDADTYTIHATDDENDAEGLATKVVVTGLHLAFLKAPVDSGVGAPISVIVQLLDAQKHVVTTDDADGVRIEFLPVGGGPEATFVRPPSTLLFHNGVAAFTDFDAFLVANAGKYTMKAVEVDANGATFVDTAALFSKAFNVATNHLSFKTGPAKMVAAGEEIPLEIQILDFKKRVVTTVTGDSVTLFLHPVGNSPDPTVTAGFNGREFVSGDVTYSSGNTFGLTSVGTYTLTAKELDADGNEVTTTASVVTKPFKVMPNMLVFKVQPTSVVANTGIVLQVWLEDFRKNVITDATNHGVHFTLNAPGSEASLGGTTIVGFVGGKVILTTEVFGDVIPLIVDTPGLYTLTATEVEKDPDTGDDLVVSTTTPITSKKFVILSSPIIGP